MKFFLLSDNIDTQIGMRLAGIEGVVAHSEADAAAALKEALRDGELGILLVTEKLVPLIRRELVEIRTSRNLPLVVEIPDRHGTTRPPDSITKYVKESIGLKF
ncbi:MAG: V-type ATP synthase subunit F [Oscillospiraceae bacterium]|nr:V-type ATP synthase subunit F [Oscillospiraceae bacterium]